jgi:hypothetical protein
MQANAAEAPSRKNTRAEVCVDMRASGGAILAVLVKNFD